MKEFLRFLIGRKVASRTNSQLVINLEGEILVEFNIWLNPKTVTSQQLFRVKGWN